MRPVGAALVARYLIGDLRTVMLAITRLPCSPGHDLNPAHVPVNEVAEVRALVLRQEWPEQQRRRHEGDDPDERDRQQGGYSDPLPARRRESKHNFTSMAAHPPRRAEGAGARSSVCHLSLV